MAFHANVEHFNGNQSRASGYSGVISSYLDSNKTKCQWNARGANALLVVVNIRYRIRAMEPVEAHVPLPPEPSRVSGQWLMDRNRVFVP